MNIAALKRQGYRIVGQHSAVKICPWTKSALLGREHCYKYDFYGIPSWSCVQMTPWIGCNHRCLYCWRDIEAIQPSPASIDQPAEIVSGCISAWKELLSGILGHPRLIAERAAAGPRHFALSLVGEPCLYPLLPQLIDELTSRGFSSFVVSNGSCPEVIAKLARHQPTQLYITIPAQTKQQFEEITASQHWSELKQSAGLARKFSRSAARLTLVKGLNMASPAGYAKLIKGFKFVECKGYMHIGYSRQRLPRQAMPSHAEVLAFAKELAKAAGLEIVGQKAVSSVVLLSKLD